MQTIYENLSVTNDSQYILINIEDPCGRPLEVIGELIKTNSNVVYIPNENDPDITVTIKKVSSVNSYPVVKVKIDFEPEYEFVDLEYIDLDIMHD
jgi:hypothetical protein